MKDSVRENLFNIVGRALDGIIAWDLFAGTGVLGIEAISRGAASAIAFESSRAAAQGIRRSAAALGIEDRVQCVVGDTFRLAPRRLAAAEGQRRIVFLCPPYEFWESREDDLQTLIQASIAGAAAGSLIVVESDKRWDNRRLPGGPWDLRVYGGTQLAVLEIEAPSESPS